MSHPQSPCRRAQVYIRSVYKIVVPTIVDSLRGRLKCFNVEQKAYAPMALVFSDRGDRGSELLGLRCSMCRETKPVEQFPASCAVYRRGTCRSCNAAKARMKCSDPLARKLESARVRYKRLGSVKLQEVAALYIMHGIDIRNEDDVKRTCLCKIRDAEPFSLANVTIKWHARDAPPQLEPKQRRAVCA